jgi:predicted  nucleic acid-binding Zn-ribbon protein
MSGPAEILKEAHRLMRYLSDLESKIAAGPRAARSAQLALGKQEETLKQLHDDLKHEKVKIHDKEVSVKQQQAHIDKLEKTPVTNKKEYDALKVEVATVQKSIRKLEDEILELMTSIEEKQGQLPELEKAVKDSKGDMSKVEQDNQEKLGRFAEERDKAKAELAELEKQVPPKMESLYTRLVAARGVEALAAVKDRNCLACHTEITQQMRQELLHGQFVVCKNCDRMLYLA